MWRSDKVGKVFTRDLEDFGEVSATHLGQKAAIMKKEEVPPDGDLIVSPSLLSSWLLLLTKPSVDAPLAFSSGYS